MDRVKIPLSSPEGRIVGSLTIALPPGSSNRDKALQVDPPERADYPIAPEVWALEASEYRYHFNIGHLAQGRTLQTLHPEMFFADDSSGVSGRFRPGNRVGTLNGGVLAAHELLAVFSIEVRSSKLGYLDEYRWMLDDITELMSSLLLQQFAPTELWLSADVPASDVSIDQRIAFLKNFVGGDGFDRAMYRITKRPHLRWREFEENRRPSQGLAGRSATARALVVPGARVPWPGSPSAVLSTLPRQIRGWRTEADADTVENRFIKFVLDSWRDFLVQTHFGLLSLGPTAAVARGLREVENLITRLDQALTADVFRTLGALQFIPSHSTVLQREEGYRDVYRAFVQYHAAAHVTWAGGEDVFAAGQRNVATLYEYWCFLRVAQIVAQISDSTIDYANLLDDASNLQLRRGQSLKIDGEAVRNGVALRLRLWFNRTFRPSGVRESWTRVLRPDISLRLEPVENPDDTVWIHFDAKYEVDGTGPLGPDGDDRNTEDAVLASEARGEVRRASLMKMHAYRDAIFNSAGVYVLYPGSRSEQATKYSELLPGLGAFVLRPLANGEAFGADAVSAFIERALTFLTTPATRFAQSRKAARGIYGAGGELP